MLVNLRDDSVRWRCVWNKDSRVTADVTADVTRRWRHCGADELRLVVVDVGDVDGDVSRASKQVRGARIRRHNNQLVFALQFVYHLCRSWL